MKAISFSCPHCRQPLEAPEELSGQLIDCPTCSRPIEVPFQVKKSETFVTERVPERHQPPLPPTRPPRLPSPSAPATPRRGKPLVLVLVLGAIAALIVVGVGMFIILSRPDPMAQMRGIASLIDGSQYTFSGRSKPDIIHSVAYDVRKTESVVSPYMGTVGFHLWSYDYEAVFAFQDGRWVLKKVEGFLGFLVADHVQKIVAQYYGRGD